VFIFIRAENYPVQNKAPPLSILESLPRVQWNAREFCWRYVAFYDKCMQCFVCVAMETGQCCTSIYG